MAEEKGVVRTIDADEEIWGPVQKEDKGNFLSVEDQMGHIQLDLTIPLELRDQEPVEYLTVRAPTTSELQQFRSVDQDKAPPSTIIKAETKFFGGCCVGIKAEDVQNLHARDWNRLCLLVVNFTA